MQRARASRRTSSATRALARFRRAFESSFSAKYLPPSQLRWCTSHTMEWAPRFIGLTFVKSAARRQTEAGGESAIESSVGVVLEAGVAIAPSCGADMLQSEAITLTHVWPRCQSGGCGLCVLACSSCRIRI